MRLSVLPAACVCLGIWPLARALPARAGESRMPVSQPVRPSPSAASPAYPLRIRLSYAVRNTLAAPCPNGLFWCRVPPVQTDRHACVHVRASHAASTNEGPDANRRLVFDLAGLPPYGAKTISVDCDLRPSSLPSAAASATPPPACAPGLAALASELAGADPMRTARNLLDWMSRNLRYTGYRERSRGAAWAAQHREGDCSEFADLAAAVLALNRIPARVAAGFRARRSFVAGPSDFHEWTEFHDGTAWRVCDAVYGVLAETETDFVVFALLPGGAEPTAAEGETERSLFGVLGPGLTVSMTE